MSNSLDPDQARQYVGPDLDLNCLQMLSADETSGQFKLRLTNEADAPSSMHVKLSRAQARSQCAI